MSAKASDNVSLEVAVLVDDSGLLVGWVSNGDQDARLLQDDVLQLLVGRNDDSQRFGFASACQMIAAQWHGSRGVRKAAKCPACGVGLVQELAVGKVNEFI